MTIVVSIVKKAVVEVVTATLCEIKICDIHYNTLLYSTCEHN